MLLINCIYSFIGTPNSIEKLVQISDLENAKSDSEKLVSVEQMLKRVERRLLDDPNNSDDWLMLANSYVVLKRYPEAIRALENLYRLKGDDPSLLFRYADVLAMANSGIFAGKPSELIKKALQLDPQNTMGLWLAGLVAYEEGEVKKAIKKTAELLKIMVEPGGAVAIAALLSKKIEVKDKTVVVMLSGGNIDYELFSTIVKKEYE